MNIIKNLLAAAVAFVTMTATVCATIVPVLNKHGVIAYYKDDVTGLRSTKAAYEAQQALAQQHQQPNAAGVNQNQAPATRSEMGTQTSEGHDKAAKPAQNTSWLQKMLAKWWTEDLDKPIKARPARTFAQMAYDFVPVIAAAYLLNRGVGIATGTYPTQSLCDRVTFSAATLAAGACCSMRALRNTVHGTRRFVDGIRQLDDSCCNAFSKVGGFLWATPGYLSAAAGCQKRAASK